MEDFGCARLNIVENSKESSLIGNIRSMLSQASEVDIAVAFITRNGIAEILQALRGFTAHGKARILTGLYHDFTEPEALSILLRLQKETSGHMTAKVSTEREFHRKLYIGRNKSETTIIIGSANLTEGGLLSAGELSISVSLPNDSLIVKRLAQLFNEDWENRAVTLRPTLITGYTKRHRQAAAEVESSKSTITLHKILGTQPIHNQLPIVRSRIILG